MRLASPLGGDGGRRGRRRKFPFTAEGRGKRIMAKVVKRGGDFSLSFFPGNCGAPSLGFFGTFTKIREIVAIARAGWDFIVASPLLSPRMIGFSPKEKTTEP